MTFRYRILLVLLAFSSLLIIFFSIGLFLSVHYVEDSVAKSFLESNVEPFIENHRRIGDKAELVNTRLIKSYYSDHLPAWLTSYGEGYHETESYLISVHRLNDDTLVYFVLDESQGVLDRYESAISNVFFGVIACLILASIFLSIKLAERVAQPLEALAESLGDDNRAEQLALSSKRNDELGMLSRSFYKIYKQLESFIEREKNFTRYVSHELRTPLTVIKSNIDMMNTRGHDEKLIQRAGDRMHHAADAIEEQIDLFLMLARENALHNKQTVDVAHELDWLIEDYPHHNISLELLDKPVILINPVAFRGMVLNLVRNAIEHGVERDGKALLIRLKHNSLQFINSFHKEAALQKNRGFGLEIMKKLADATHTEFSTRTEEDSFIAELSWMAQAI